MIDTFFCGVEAGERVRWQPVNGDTAHEVVVDGRSDGDVCFRGRGHGKDMFYTGLLLLSAAL